MSEQDLPPTTGGATDTSANGTAAPRPRRNNNRRPARTTTAVEETPEVAATPTNTVTEAEVAADTAQNAPGGRSRRGARGRGNKNARPEAEAETPTDDAPNAISTPAPAESAAPRAEVPPTLVAAAPAVRDVVVEPTAASTTPMQSGNNTSDTHTPSRYRFDRRAYNPTFPTSEAPKAEAPVPPGELRRSGAFSRLFNRPAPAPAPVVVAPPEVETPRPSVSSPVPAPTEAPRTPALTNGPTTTPAFARSAPLHVVEPEEITLPRTVSSRPTPSLTAAVTPPAFVPVPAPAPLPVVAPEPKAVEPLDEVTEDSTGSDDYGSQSGERRNRRRRRGGRNGNGNGHHTDALDDAPEVERVEVPAERSAVAAPASQPQVVATYAAPPVAPRPQPSYVAPTPAPVLPTPEPSPYGSPEPSYARGFGPTSRGVASEYRSPTAPAHSRFARNEGAPISTNQLASVIAEALQQQTDRLLAEQHRHGSAPTFTISMPSTERVGVYVDVANLLYSSRSMRIPIDFGKLLQFLKGDRRLIRAHAYAPTSPDPYADQQFLAAVKGLGYRITTKDYKTFSSGAKKADLDLDICMGIVRIVDAGAVDTIVLVSGDSDFLPVLDYCADHGVRVEVAAFDESTAAILRQSCDLFLNLSLVEEIRA